MAFNLTRTKLSDFTDSIAFEQMCTSLLQQDYLRIIPLGGTGDRGRDAVELPTVRGHFQTEGGSAIFQFSLQKDWKTKLRKDVKKVVRNGFRPATYVYVTNQDILTAQRDKVKEEISREYPFEIEPLGLEWLRVRLESPPYLAVRRQYLGLDETTLPAFLPSDEYAIRRPDVDSAPALEVFVGRQAELQSIDRFISSGMRVLVVSGGPGFGKTRLLLEAAKRVDDDNLQVVFLRPEVDSLERHFQELNPNSRYLVVLDDAHELQHFRSLLTLMQSPEFKDRLLVVAATHPWAECALKKEFASRGLVCEELDLERLSNAHIDELLQHDSLGIRDERARGAIVSIAEGNPLIAISAARHFQEKGRLTGITRHQFLSAYFSRRLQEALGDAEDIDRAQILLGTISATKGIEYGEQALRRTLADVIGISQGKLNTMIDQLVSVGLIRRTWSKVRVVPELFAKHIAYDTFFAEGHKHDFQETVLTPFFVRKGDQIFRTLAEAETMGVREATEIINRGLSEASAIVKEVDNAGRLSILHWLKGFAPLRPEDTLVIVRSMLEVPKEETSEVQSRLWGKMPVTHADVMRETCTILRETWLHCESCLRETINLLYLISDQQDHSRANQDPWGDSVRVLIEEVISYQPDKSLKVQSTALETIENWMSKPPSEQQQRTIAKCLAALLSITWHTTTASYVEPHTVTLRDGVLEVSDDVRDIRVKAIQLLCQLYGTASCRVRLEIIGLADQVLGPYLRGDTTEDIRRVLTGDAEVLFPSLIAMSSAEAIAERYHILRAIRRLRSFGYLSKELSGMDCLDTADVTMFGHLIEWLGRSYDGVTDWREAERLHRSYWRGQVERAAHSDLGSFLRRLDFLIGQALLTGGELGAVSVNLGIACNYLRELAPEQLRDMVQGIPDTFASLGNFAGIVLGELYICDYATATSIGRNWITSGDLMLQREACRALLWVAEFGAPELEQVKRLASLCDAMIDGMLARFAQGHLVKLQRHFPEAAVEILRTIATRCSEPVLAEIAWLLEEPERPDDATRLVHVPPEDLKELAANFVRVPDLDRIGSYHIEGMLSRLYKQDVDAWLGFWEARINRQMEEQPGGHYRAVPFRLPSENACVMSSTDRLKVLGTFLEWSSRPEWVFKDAGAQLFNRYSGGAPSVTEDIVAEWVSSEDVAKLRAVARTIKETGYCECFLQVAKTLLSKTDDELVEAYLNEAIGTTGIVAGSLNPVYQERKAALEAWLTDPEVSLRAKAFARRHVDWFASQLELVTSEDWDD